MKTPFIFPDILLPERTVPIETWPVIACDQFTSNPQYWKDVESAVSDSPSTLRLILPEIYLEQPDQTAREEAIRTTMRRYIDNGILQTIPATGVYVRRHLGNGVLRRGLVVAVDLESYDFDPSKRSMIRASEETIPERLPPRASIRRGAPMETPHVLVLIDDPDDTVMSTLEERHAKLEKLYDTELMLGGGAVAGYAVPKDSEIANAVVRAFDSLSTVKDFGFQMATGDGNHSLAAAKTVWDERKAQGTDTNDPFRYCLVELVNVYDPGLPFHPIHRLVEIDETTLLDGFLHSTDTRFHSFSHRDLQGYIERDGLASHEIAFFGPNQSGVLSLPSDADLAVAVADEVIRASNPLSVDYVHGLDEVVSVARDNSSVAIVLPEINRSGLFATVANRGTLPRKAFSLGEARDKRYYLECRQLT